MCRDATTRHRRTFSRCLQRMSMVSASDLPILSCKHFPSCSQSLCDVAVCHSPQALTAADAALSCHICNDSGNIANAHYRSIRHRICNAWHNQHYGCRETPICNVDCSLYRNIGTLQLQLVYPPILLCSWFYV